MFKPIAGHMDIVRDRTEGAWVLDHKPNLNDPMKFSSQMFIYREALHRRTSVPRERITIAAFNEHGLCRFEDPELSEMRITDTGQKRT